MANPAATSLVCSDPYPGRPGRGGPADDVDVYSGGHDTQFLARVGCWMVTADATVSIETVDGTVLTFGAKASTIYPLRVRRLRATGTVLGGALFVVFV